MPVPLNNPLVIPERAAKVATLRWIKSIAITCPNPQSEGRIVVEFVPMTESGEIIEKNDAGQSLVGVIQTDSLFADLANVPELQAAMDAILAAIPAVEEAQGNS
jgi:hypothetical protein